MLTARQNFREVIRGGNPDRHVNQFEALSMIPSPFRLFYGDRLKPGMINVVNAWGVTNSYAVGTPGSFPVHTPERIVIKDITRWRDYVKAPPLVFSNEQLDIAKEQYAAVDPRLTYRTALVTPGIFEQTHHLSEITNALINFMTEPQKMHELIKYLTEWELQLAEIICTHLKPEAMFHHDDWGTETTTFLRPEMFAEFFVEPYKQLYGYYHDHGVELVIHHSDSYSATLVPYMIEMGIDVWQGCMRANNVPELVSRYGGQISFMGNIDNKDIDIEGWTQENCRNAVRRACEACENRYYIPCITQGGPGSVYPGTYEVLTAEIDAYNKERFGIENPERGRP